MPAPPFPEQAEGRNEGFLVIIAGIITWKTRRGDLRIHLQRRDEGALWDIDVAHAAHALLAFFLLF